MTLTLALGIFNKALVHASIVAPVVITSSIKRKCFPLDSALFRTSNKFLFLVCRSILFFLVCVLEYSFLNKRALL